MFGIWAIDFMGPFLISNHKFILDVVDYMSKWVEVQVLLKKTTLWL